MTTETPRADDLRMDVGALVGAVLSRWLRIVTVTLVLLALAYAVLMVTPKMYESSASILVEARDNAFTGPATATGNSSGGAAVTIDALVSSQVELIKSRDTLLAVVDQLNLRSVPEFNGAGANPLGFVFQLVGRKPEARNVDETVLQNLADRLTVIRERDSAIISVTVRSQSPQLAADIANAVAAEHLKRRTDQSLQDTAEASAWLEQEIVKLRQRVADAETAVAKYRSDNDLFQGTNNSSLLDQQLSALATQITAAQERRNAAQTRASMIRKMIEVGQPIDGLADVQSSVVIQQLSQSKATLQGELAQRSSTLLPNHPTIRALNAQIREIDRQISAEGRRVAASLDAEAKIEADLVASLQDELKSMKASAASAATQSVTLDQLQREAKAQRDLLESYLLRYRDALSRSDSSSALPDVRIVSKAAPSVTPASPKVGLMLAAVGIGALALQVGAIIFGELLSGRAVVDHSRTVVRRREEPIDEVVPPADEPLLPLDGAAVVEERKVVEETTVAVAPHTTEAVVTEAAAAEDTVARESRGWFRRRREAVVARTEPDVETVVEAAAALEPVPVPAPAIEETVAESPPEPTVPADGIEVQPEARPARKARGLFGRRSKRREPVPAAASEEIAAPQVEAVSEAVTEPEPEETAPIEAGPAEPAIVTADAVAEALAVARGAAVAESLPSRPKVEALVEAVEAPVADLPPAEVHSEVTEDIVAAEEPAEPMPAEPARRVGWLARIWGRRTATVAPAAADIEPLATEPTAPESAEGDVVADASVAATTEASAVVETTAEAEQSAAPAEPVAPVAEEPVPDIAPEPTLAAPPMRPAARMPTHEANVPVPRSEPVDTSGRYPSALATLGADIALGRVRVVMIAGLSTSDDCAPVAEALVAQALRAGLSVVRVDAGSGDVSSDPGITDLAAERASFGDIVHKGTREGLSEVPWGHQAALDRRSTKPNTLVEALTDIYEVVVVSTGRVGMSSSLPMFSGIAGRLVLASVGRADADHVEAALAETAALGFRQAQVIVAPTRHAEVA